MQNNIHKNEKLLLEIEKYRKELLNMSHKTIIKTETAPLTPPPLLSEQIPSDNDKKLNTIDNLNVVETESEEQKQIEVALVKEISQNELFSAKLQQETTPQTQNITIYNNKDRLTILKAQNKNIPEMTYMQYKYNNRDIDIKPNNNEPSSEILSPKKQETSTTNDEKSHKDSKAKFTPPCLQTHQSQSNSPLTITKETAPNCQKQCVIGRKGFAPREDMYQMAMKYKIMDEEQKELAVLCVVNILKQCTPSNIEVYMHRLATIDASFAVCVANALSNQANTK